MPRKYTYAELRERGLCVTCGKVNDTPEVSRCASCREKRNQYRRENAKYFLKIGLCTKCGKRKPEPNKHMCEECLEKEREYDKRRDKEKRKENSLIRMQRAKAEGKCTSCKNRKATYGVYCARCYSKQIRYKNEHKCDIARSERPAYNECYICGKPSLVGKSVCAECYKERLRCIEFAQEGLKKSGNNYFKKLNKAFWESKKNEGRSSLQGMHEKAD